MLDEDKKRMIAREIIILSGIVILTMLLGKSGLHFNLLLIERVGILYLARWLCWALARGDKGPLKESVTLLFFVIGVILVAGALPQLGGAFSMLVRSAFGTDFVLSVAMAVLFGVPGVFLMRFAIRRTRADREDREKS